MPDRKYQYLYALTIFLGAFLLFQVQPLIGKFILPWYGGSPEVWTTCMLFFQVLLLGGYAYAHAGSVWLPPRGQAIIHGALLAGVLLMLSIVPAPSLKPHGSEHPIGQILMLLARCIGLPFFVLSATGPLLQRWFSQTHPLASPYRLYALSNTASLLALVSYPFLFEPYLSRLSQARAWSAVLILFVILCGCCSFYYAVYFRRSLTKVLSPAKTHTTEKSANFSTIAFWIGLPAVASVELLAVTNKICQDIAAIPFLWIAPLTLYLLSFILCFHSEKSYIRPLWTGLFILFIVVVSISLYYCNLVPDLFLIIILLAMLFSCCMVCHGELYRLRSKPTGLTRYYLMISIGGAGGGFFVAVLSPVIFKTYLELKLGLLAGCLLILLLDKTSAFLQSRRRRLFWTTLLFCTGCCAFFFEGSSSRALGRAILHERNFFGVLTLWQTEDDNLIMRRRVLQHGTTFHGLQFTDPGQQDLPTAYYGRRSGIGRVLECLAQKDKRRIGVVGLGVGTLASYGRQNDYFCFYEINPAVRELAQTSFTYLSRCPAAVEIVMGDARLSLEQQPDQEYDILVLDAFSSDAVPVHLLTVEAFEIYLRHLHGDGVIAVHISNVNLDLGRVVGKLGEFFHIPTVQISDPGEDADGTFPSRWILLTRDHELLRQKKIQSAAARPEESPPVTDLWTDDHVNLFQILR